MHALIEWSPLLAGVLNFLASAIRLAACAKTDRQRSGDDIKTSFSGTSKSESTHAI